MLDNDAILGISIGGSCCLLLTGGLVAIVVGTIMKTRFGLNFGAARCGECGNPVPTVRAPRNLYEMLWGGWTCDRCGCENDKWGRPR